MASTRGEIVDDVLRALRRSLSDADRLMVERYVNRFYFDICRMVPIKSLRRRLEVDLSSSTYSDGMWLPSNMAGVLSVNDKEDGFYFIERDRAGVEADDYSYRYYTYTPSGGPLFSGSDLVVRKGSSTFAASSLTDDHTGYYVKFSTEPGMFLLTAAKAFTPAYRGPDLTQDMFVVRPDTTEKLVCIDSDEAELRDRTVYVNYWEIPSPLYADTDTPLLPTTRPLELMVMKEALSVIGKRQLSSSSYDRDIKSAMDELKKMCPSPMPTLRARDVLNKTFSFSEQIFGERE